MKPPTKISKHDLMPHTRVVSGFPPVPEPTRISRGELDDDTLLRSGWVCGFCMHVRRVFRKMSNRRES